MEKNTIYQCLFEAYVKEYLTKSKQVTQEELIQKWNKIKNDANLKVQVDHWLQELKAVFITKGITFYVFG